MKYSLVAFALCLVGFVAPVLLDGPAYAHEFAASDIKIDHPWARPTVTTRQPAAVFFHLENTGERDDTLVGVEVGVDIAEGAELHTTINDEGIFRMRPLASGIALPAGAEVAVQPGGHHVMLFGLAEPLAEGRRFAVTLVFEQAGRVEVGVVVEQPTKEAPKPEIDHAGHGS